ncbi:RBP1 protein, partial [Pardalotus punctatus]|nr:RBP1 protein [Pardalotus punctatus]
ISQCFLPPTSISSKHKWGEHHEDLVCTPSSEEIHPTKFLRLYCTGEPWPPH